MMYKVERNLDKLWSVIRASKPAPVHTPPLIIEPLTDSSPLGLQQVPISQNHTVPSSSPADHVPMDVLNGHDPDVDDTQEESERAAPTTVGLIGRVLRLLRFR